MGTTYLIYTEAKIDDKWRCIDGFLNIKSYDGEEKLRLATTYENGSRSYFGSTYDELRELGHFTLYSELSKEVKEAHPSLRYKYSWDGEEAKEEESYLVVPYKAFVEKCPSGFSKHGIIHKDDIFLFENREIEELYQEDELDFSKMSELEKQAYKYYEWDNPFDWPCYFKVIKGDVEHTIDKYMTNSWIFERPEIRLVCFAL